MQYFYDEYFTCNLLKATASFYSKSVHSGMTFDLWAITLVIPVEPSSAVQFRLFANNNCLKGVPEIIPVFYGGILFIYALYVCVCMCVTWTTRQQRWQYAPFIQRKTLHDAVYNLLCIFSQILLSPYRSCNSVPTNSFLKNHSFLIARNHMHFYWFRNLIEVECGTDVFLFDFKVLSDLLFHCYKKHSVPAPGRELQFQQHDLVIESVEQFRCQQDH